MGRRESKSGWERLRDREDREEEERQEAAELARLKGGGRSAPVAGSPSSSLADEAAALKQDGSSQKIQELLDRVEPLLEQVHKLYAQYFSGIEKIPPVERRKQLEQTLQALMMIAKPNQMIQFRCNGIQQRYRTYSEQWDKKLRDLESGKIKRGHASG